MQARRHRPRPVLRVRDHRPRSRQARTPVRRHRPQPRLPRPLAQDTATAARPRPGRHRMTTTAAPPAAVTKPGLIHNMPDATYHSDPVPAGSLSSTGARLLLDSPARYHHELNNRQGRRAFDVGHVIHTKILGTGAPIVTYPDEHLTPSGNPSTKAAT